MEQGGGREETRRGRGGGGSHKGGWGEGETKGTCVLNTWKEQTMRSACFIFMCSRCYITQERYNKACKRVVRSP